MSLLPYCCIKDTLIKVARNAVGAVISSRDCTERIIAIDFESSSSYPYPIKWGRYNMLSSYCDKDSAYIFTTGCLPDVNPP
jgi:hypothetical protein